MKTLELKTITSMEVDLQTFQPDHSGYVLSIEVEIGFERELGADLFRFNIADSKGFINHLLGNDTDYLNNKVFFISGYDLIIIENYTFKTLVENITKILVTIDLNGSWNFIANQLNDYFTWEYQREFKEKLR